ncbi:MAG: APC family permease [Oscillospiraceae bacterium]|nr:APC family permease [Oscillospiraceae bacterium]
MGETKKLGLGSGIAVCVGLILATSCLLSLGYGVGLAGASFILPLFVVLILNSFIAFSFAELHSLMPSVNGGVGQYTLVGMGPVASIFSNTAVYVITMILASSVELSMCGLVLSDLFPQIPALSFSMVVLLILFTLNLFGLNVFSKVQNLVVILLLGSIVVLGVISFFRLIPERAIPAQEIETPAVVGLGGVMGLSAIAFWLFIGVEFIIPVAKDLKKPRRDVILSMILALLILFVVQAVMGVGMTHYVALSELSASEMPHMAFAEALLGPAGRVWMGIVTLLAGASTLNTVLPSTARILQGMGEENLVPRSFTKVNKKNVPVLGMLLILVVDTLLLVTGFVNSSGMVNIILAASCFWLTSYILTHTNVLILRRRYPDLPRYKKLMLLGLPQILGIAGNVYMIWNISDDMDNRITIYKIFGIIFVLLAAYSVIWVKFALKTRLFKPLPIERLNSPPHHLLEPEKEA